jgi:hypothetical protein
LVNSDTTIDITLPDGWLLSGKVSNPAGDGLPLIEVSLRDAMTGAKQFVSNNETDSLGNYQVAVSGGMYELQFSGRPGTRVVGLAQDSILIESDLVWDQILEEGFLLSIKVEDEFGVAIKKADIDIKLAVTVEKLFTPNDRTDDTGWAGLALLPDLYQVELDPPFGSPYDQVILPDFSLTGDTAITVVMPSVTRVALTGRVIDESGSGLEGVRFNLISTATGRELFVPDNLSDSIGLFSLAAPTGTIDVRIAPLEGSRLVGQAIRGLTVTSDSSLGEITIPEGVVVSVQANDTDGFPVVDVDLDLTDLVTGLEVYTPYDNTDVGGLAMVNLLPGEYSVLLDPPDTSGLEQFFVGRVSIQGDTLLTFLLGANPGGGSPSNMILGQNYPNPFNAGTSIPVTLVSGSNVKIEVFNVLGQTVVTVTDRYYQAGNHIIAWDCRDAGNHPVASGSYFYRVTTPLATETRQMILIR